MSRPKGSKNLQSPSSAAADDVFCNPLLIKIILALMANPNVYPKHNDATIVAMAKRMIVEIGD